MSTTIVPPAVVEADEPQVPRPSRAPRPERARSEPIVVARRPTARPSLPVRMVQSLVAPPLALPLTRGVGVFAAAFTATLVGLIDGVSTAAREDGGMSFGTRALVVAHCVAVYLLVAALWGVAAEAVLRAGTRLLPARAFVAWLLDGPRRWFARDPGLTHRTLLVMLGVATLLGGTFPASLAIVSFMHSKALIALAVTSVVAVMIPVALLGVVMVASPLRWLLERAGRFASPGGVLVGAVALVGAALVRAAASEGTWSDELPWSAAEFTAAFLASDLVLMCLLGAWRRRVVTGGSWRAVAGALVVMIATGATSALTLARRQTVAVAVSAHSALASVIVYGFQRVFDRDRDGHSALFNGGDCNDRDPRVRPGLRDVPGNGVDEDCSGRDAVALREETDGAYAPPPAAITRARPSFVLLTVDTLRPDHLGAYGYARPTTPNLDAFARQSALFTRAYTTSPRTLRAFASVWTGRFPSRVAWGADNLFPALEESNATLAETLREAGYATGAFCDSDYFRATVGFFQGYDAVHEGRAFKSDPAETARAFEDWLAARERSPQPFFAWLHLLEPHFPYRHRVGAEGFGPLALDRYDDEVARADAALGQVLRAVDAFGAAHPDRPLVVVMTADHGEALGEQGRTGHGVDLHEESVRIPLIVRAPGVAPGPRSALVSLLDVHATVLNLAGLPVRGAVQSRSLVRHLVTTTSRVEGERLFTEVTPDGFIPHEQKALYRPPWKLLWDVRRNTWELYNLADDRAEARNVYDERRDVADGLREELLAWAGEAWRNRRDALLAAARLRELPAMQRRLGVRFGDVMELVGCDLPEGGVQAGGTIRVTLYLRALAPSRRLLRLGMWFESEDGRSLGTRFHASHYPVQGQYRTTEWAPGELLRDEVTLRVSPHERSMRLRLWFNVIEDGTFQAIESDQSTGANHSVSLGEIEIVGQSPSVVSHDE